MTFSTHIFYEDKRPIRVIETDILSYSTQLYENLWNEATSQDWFSLFKHDLINTESPTTKQSLKLTYLYVLWPNNESVKNPNEMQTQDRLIDYSYMIGFILLPLRNKF